jgi:FkbM family methyltransferase
MVGPENMVLIEPTREFWPNIRQTWERNFYARPKACYQGLIGNLVTDDREPMFDWPHCSEGWIVDRNKYQYIHANEDGVPQITLDELVKRSGVVPDAITMDIEGAEMLALQGAAHTLKKYKPLVWVSVHPDLGAKNYNMAPEDVHRYMSALGYVGEHLAVDHESHWFYRPRVGP